MKNFFTLFALLSVGLSAWAQDYKVYYEDQECYYKMKKNEDGKFSVRKILYAIDNNLDISFVDSRLENEFYTTQFDVSEYINDDNRWVDLTFSYDPDTEESTILHNGGTVESDDWLTTIHLSDEVTIGSAGDNLNISYTRSGCEKHWGTLCLPFNFSTRNINAELYQLSSVTKDAMYFSKYEGENNVIPSGTPLVFKIKGSTEELSISTEVESLVFPYNPEFPEYSKDGWTMYGTPVDETTINEGWVMQRKEICKVVDENFPIKPYRVWFTGTRPSDAPLRIEEDDTEDLQFVEQEDGTVKVYYDLQGCKLDDAQKGLLIENGKVIMFK